MALVRRTRPNTFRLARIEHITHAVADQIEGQDGDAARVS
jgi:hypothetical protein